MFLLRQLGERAVGVAEVLHEHEVPDLEEPLLGAVGRPAVVAVALAEVPEDLRAGTARPGRATRRAPPVVGPARWAVRAVRALPRSSSTRARRYGAEGGPAHGGEERYLEFWNLVFMQFNRAARRQLDRRCRSTNIDTGAGLERILALLQGVDSVFDTDVLAPLRRRGPVGHRRALRRRPSAATCRCASWPITPAP